MPTDPVPTDPVPTDPVSRGADPRRPADEPVPGPGVLPPSAHPRVAAGLLIRDRDGRVLLVDPTYKPLWDLPGGLIEIGESPARAAGREVREELGLSLPVGRLLVVDWAPLGDDDRLLFVFDGGVLSPAELDTVQVDGVEIARFRMVPVTGLGPLVPRRLAARIGTALDTLAGGEPYAEHGVTPAVR